MRGHLICVSHQNSLNHCDSYLTLIQERLIGNRKEDMHLLSGFLWCEWHHQGLGDLPVCVWISGGVFEESDRFRLPLGLCHLSVQHTRFLSCMLSTLHTQRHEHTLCWIICHAALLSSFATCSVLQFLRQKPYYFNAITSHLTSSQDSPPLFLSFHFPLSFLAILSCHYLIARIRRIRQEKGYGCMPA